MTRKTTGRFTVTFPETFPISQIENAELSLKQDWHMLCIPFSAWQLAGDTSYLIELTEEQTGAFSAALPVQIQIKIKTDGRTSASNIANIKIADILCEEAL